MTVADRHSMPSVTETVELRLEAAPDSASAARAFVREHTTLDGMRHAEADLLVTELIGNVLGHSNADEFTVGVEKERARGVVVSVSHLHATPLSSPPEGVGFMLLRRLSRDWGHTHSDNTLSVWFSLRTPGTVSVSEEMSDSDLFSRMSDDPPAYSDALVRRHEDLAISIAHRYRGKGVDADDLLQVAKMALLKAIQRYDPSIGTIRPYAAATISGELKRLLRDRGWSVRVPRSLQERSLQVARANELLAQRLNRPADIHEIADHLGITPKDVMEAMEARNAYVSNSIDKPTEPTGLSLLERLEGDDFGFTMADDRMMVEEAIKKLPERQQRILDLRFNKDMTQTEIAGELGISQMHVSRLLSSAFETLKRGMRN